MNSDSSESLSSPFSQTFTLGRLCEIAGGDLVQGDPDLEILGVAEIDHAEEGQISYAVDEKYARKIDQSGASAVVLSQGIPFETQKPILVVPNAYAAFARILAAFEPKAPMQEPKIHPQAYVHPTAQLADDVVVGPNATIDAHCKVGQGTRIEAGSYLGPRSVVGERCHLFPNATVHRDSILGDRVVVQSGSVIGGDGYGYVFFEGAHQKIPQIGRVVLEDGVEIGSCVTIDRATIGETRLGAGTKIDNLVQIGHNVKVGEHCLFVSQVGISGSTTIGDHCRFAGQSAAAGHISIGDQCTVAARGAVTKELPSKSFVSGFPAKPHRQEKRIVVSLARLPDALKKIRELEKELQELRKGSPKPSTQEDSP